MNRQLATREIARSLVRFKARTVLGGVGIVVSVVATVFVLSMSSAASASFGAFVSRLYPSDVVVVNSGASFMGGGSGARNMRLREIDAVASSVPQIVAWDVRNFAGFRQVRADSRTTWVAVMGTGAQAPAVRRRSVSRGSYIDQADVSSRARVALIGTTASNALFGASSPLGATIFIDNMPFQVKGVLQRQGANPHGDDEDNVIVVPFTLAMESLLKVDYVRQVAYQVQDASQVEAVGRRVAAIMRQQHGIVDGRVDDFSVVVPRQMREMVDGTLGTMKLFIVLICGAAFLISALVVLAVMHVSVRQRTPELGLRKAVGASSGALRSQILWESLVIALASCTAGVLIAWAAVSAASPVLAARFGIVGGSVSWVAIVAGAAAALGTGLIGALMPALRAARLDPVEALRSR